LKRQFIEEREFEQKEKSIYCKRLQNFGLKALAAHMFKIPLIRLF